MSKKCKSCGAPLVFSEKDEQIKCSYCGAINTHPNLYRIINNFFHQEERQPKSNFGVFIGNRRATRPEIIVIISFLVVMFLSVIILIFIFV